MTVPVLNYVTETIDIEPDVEAVLVSWDDHFSYPKMVKANTYLHRSAKYFIATSAGKRSKSISFVSSGQI